MPGDQPKTTLLDELAPHSERRLPEFPQERFLSGEVTNDKPIDKFESGKFESG